MPTRSRITFIAAATAIVALAPVAQTQTPLAKPDSSGYVAANGVDYWFEIRGKGEPLLLLHGGLMSSSMFGPVLTKLAENRRVISVDLHVTAAPRSATGKSNWSPRCCRNRRRWAPRWPMQ